MCITYVQAWSLTSSASRLPGYGPREAFSHYCMHGGFVLKSFDLIKCTLWCCVYFMSQPMLSNCVCVCACVRTHTQTNTRARIVCKPTQHTCCVHSGTEGKRLNTETSGCFLSKKTDAAFTWLVSALHASTHWETLRVKLHSGKKVTFHMGYNIVWHIK